MPRFKRTNSGRFPRGYRLPSELDDGLPLGHDAPFISQFGVRLGERIGFRNREAGGDIAFRHGFDNPDFQLGNSVLH